MPNDSNPVGIKQIAQALGVSIGTVDRALYNRPGINPLTRQRVMKMAATLGYRPNLAARLLKSGKQLIIRVNLPREIASFFDAVRAGIQQAAAPFEALVRVDIQLYRRLGEGDARLFEEAVEAGVGGIIIAPGHPAEMRPLIRKAAQRNIPVVCVATDAPGTERLTAVSADPYTSGAVVAELLHKFRCNGPAAVITGFPDTVDHAEKVRGFRAVSERCGSVLSPIEVLESHDDEREAFQQTRELLDRHPGLAAIYVATANSLPVCKAIEKARRSRQVTVITTDLFPQLTPLLKSGVVAATMYQRPISQGRLAFEALHQFLVDGRCPPAQIKLVPHIVMDSNLDLIMEKLGS